MAVIWVCVTLLLETKSKVAVTFLTEGDALGFSALQHEYLSNKQLHLTSLLGGKAALGEGFNLLSAMS